jgi:hypothetical protein
LEFYDLAIAELIDELIQTSEVRKPSAQTWAKILEIKQKYQYLVDNLKKIVNNQETTYTEDKLLEIKNECNCKHEPCKCLIELEIEGAPKSVYKFFKRIKSWANGTCFFNSISMIFFK